MIRCLFILLLLAPLQERPDYPLKNGRPTSKGIDRYIEENGDALIMELQDFIGDTLYNTYLYTEDLSKNGDHDSLELGFYYPNEIFITNAEVFLAYEVGELSKKERDSINHSNLFVKAAVFHELMHHYIYQVGIEMLRTDHIEVDRAYQSFFSIYSNRENPGSRFIEEGICEYVTLKMNEIIPPKQLFVPTTLADLTRQENRYNIFYKYSSHCLSGFLDTTGLKQGMKILLHNRP
ncbi:MAG: hypothetical protein K8R52_10285, partial [Bacteroidales bacterium]|nr:hypothetical protein [Bacteroidales bacterium]